MVSQPTSFGNVSLGQSLKFISSLIKTDITSFCTAFRAWSATAGWWETNKEIDWVTRDEWRVEMGLKPRNPILEKGEVKLFLKLVNPRSFFSDPKTPNAPPEGFRFAKEDECVRFRELPLMSYPVILHDNEGCLSIMLYPRHELFNYENRGIWLRDKEGYLALIRI